MSDRPPELVGSGLTLPDIDNYNGRVLAGDQVIVFSGPCSAGPEPGMVIKLDGRVYHVGGEVRLASGQVLEAEAYFLTYRRRWLAGIFPWYLDRHYGLTRDMTLLKGVSYRPGAPFEGFGDSWIDVTQHHERPGVEYPPDRRGGGAWTTVDSGAYEYIGPGMVGRDAIRELKRDGKTYWVRGAIRDGQGVIVRGWLLVTTHHFRSLEAAYLQVDDRLVEIRAPEGREQLARLGIDLKSCRWEPQVRLVNRWREEDFVFPAELLTGE